MTPTSFATDKEPQHMSLKLKFIIKVKIGLSVNFISDFSVRSVSKSCDCDATKGNDTLQPWIPTRFSKHRNKSQTFSSCFIDAYFGSYFLFPCFFKQ